MSDLFDFDTPIDRNNTRSVKWDRYKDVDILPLWVADTDFTAAPVIQQALAERVAHGVFGYSNVPSRLPELIVERMQRLYQWEIKRQWIVWLPCVVSGLNIACRSMADESPSVAVPSVLYPYFDEAIRQAGQRAENIPLELRDSRWVVDPDWLSSDLDDQCRIMLFCNPQNPGGSVYRREELLRLAEIAQQKDLVFVSDEIHCDLLLEPGLEHIPIASLNSDIERRSITLMSTSKCFNIAGLNCAYAIIPDQALRRKFLNQKTGIVPYNNVMGLVATQAAYESGDEWLDQMRDYLRRNRDYLMGEMNQIKGIKIDSAEATYLAWIDVSGLALADPSAFFEAAGVGLSAGKEYGDDRFMRLNFGCTHALLEEAVSRIRKAVNQHWENQPE